MCYCITALMPTNTAHTTRNNIALKLTNRAYRKLLSLSQNENLTLSDLT